METAESRRLQMLDRDRLEEGFGGGNDGRERDDYRGLEREARDRREGGPLDYYRWRRCNGGNIRNVPNQMPCMTLSRNPQR